MNILKRFARQAKKATATDAELFYDLEKETVAYLDRNGKSVGLLNKKDDAPSDKCTLLVRTDGNKVNKITAQNSLNVSDYLFDLEVRTILDPKAGETKSFSLKNKRAKKVFSDMNITKINFDHLFLDKKEIHVRWNIEDDHLNFSLYDGNNLFEFTKGTIVSIWLEIEVFKNVESEVIRVISKKEKEQPKKEDPKKDDPKEEPKK